MDPVLAQLVEHLTVVVYFPGIKWSLVQIQQTGFLYIFFSIHIKSKNFQPLKGSIKFLINGFKSVGLTNTS